MRASLLFLIIVSVLLLVSTPLNAQSTLTFARVMSAAELSLTGYAVVNPGRTSANVLFALRAFDGTLINSSVQVVPAGGQVARLASELFPNAAAGGWVQAASASPNLRGFWLGGDFATFADSAEAAPSAGELVLPVISTDSEVHFVNPTAASQVILIRIVGPEGQDITDPEIRVLPASGSFRSKSNLLFAAADLSRATHARVSCNMCAGSVLLKDYLAAPSMAVANGIGMASAARQLDFPHVIQGTLSGLTYSTVVSVTNLTSSAQTLTLTFTSETGAASIPVTRELPAGGTLRETAETMFSFANSFQSGWIRVIGELPIAGIVVYAELVNRAVAVTPAATVTATGLFLSHIADLTPWSTGIAILNPGTATALVEIYAINPSGTRIGHAEIAVAAGGKIARLLSEYIPETLARPRDGGFIFLKSSEPVYGLELFFRRDLKVLSNVPAFGLAPGEVFTPPPL